MIMDRNVFSVVLPSNSNPVIFPNNNPSDFSVEFTNPIILNGQCEVALSEITYYNELNVLKKSYIEIYKHDYKDNIFSLCGNYGFFRRWNFNDINLPAFMINGLANIMTFCPSEKKVALVPDKKHDRQAVVKGLQDLFRPLEPIIRLAMNKDNKPMIVPSEEEWRKNRHVAILFNKEFTDALGLKSQVYSSRHLTAAIGKFKFTDKVNPKAFVIPLYALKSKKIVIKRSDETISSAENLIHRLKSVFVKSFWPDILFKVLGNNLISFEKTEPFGEEDACVIEINFGFLQVLASDQTPLICNKNEKFNATIVTENLQKKVAQQQEWSLIVYHDEVDLSRLEKTNNLQDRHTLNVHEFQNPSSLCKKLNELSNKEKIGSYEFSYDPKIERMKVKVPTSHEIHFDSIIQNVLGFSKSSSVEAGTTVADARPNLVRGIHNLYIYTNIVEWSRVGNIEAPLLRTLPLSTVQKQIINREFINRVYVPINRNIIDRIDISIRDDAGDVIPFDRSGITVLTLEIRANRS